MDDSASNRFILRTTSDAGSIGSQFADYNDEPSHRRDSEDDSQHESSPQKPSKRSKRGLDELTPFSPLDTEIAAGPIPVPAIPIVLGLSATGGAVIKTPHDTSGPESTFMDGDSTWRSTSTAAERPDPSRYPTRSPLAGGLSGRSDRRRSLRAPLQFTDAPTPGAAPAPSSHGTYPQHAVAGTPSNSAGGVPQAPRPRSRDYTEDSSAADIGVGLSASGGSGSMMVTESYTEPSGFVESSEGQGSETTPDGPATTGKQSRDSGASEADLGNRTKGRGDVGGDGSSEEEDEEDGYSDEFGSSMESSLMSNNQRLAQSSHLDHTDVPSRDGGNDDNGSGGSDGGGGVPIAVEAQPEAVEDNLSAGRKPFDSDSSASDTATDSDSDSDTASTRSDEVSSQAALEPDRMVRHLQQAQYVLCGMPGLSHVLLAFFQDAVIQGLLADAAQGDKADSDGQGGGSVSSARGRIRACGLVQEGDDDDHDSVSSWEDVTQLRRQLRAWWRAVEREYSAGSVEATTPAALASSQYIEFGPNFRVLHWLPWLSPSALRYQGRMPLAVQRRLELVRQQVAWQQQQQQQQQLMRAEQWTSGRDVGITGRVRPPGDSLTPLHGDGEESDEGEVSRGSETLDMLQPAHSLAWTSRAASEIQSPAASRSQAPFPSWAFDPAQHLCFPARDTASSNDAHGCENDSADGEGRERDRSETIIPPCAPPTAPVLTFAAPTPGSSPQGPFGSGTSWGHIWNRFIDDVRAAPHVHGLVLSEFGLAEVGAQGRLRRPVRQIPSIQRIVGGQGVAINSTGLLAFTSASASIPTSASVSGLRATRSLGPASSIAAAGPHQLASASVQPTGLRESGSQSGGGQSGVPPEISLVGPGRGFRSLRHLNLNCTLSFDRIALKAVADACPHLLSLSAARCPRLTNATALLKCASLRWLDLTGCSLEEDGIAELLTPKLKSLVYLNVSANDEISDTSLLMAVGDMVSFEAANERTLRQQNASTVGPDTPGGTSSSKPNAADQLRRRSVMSLGKRERTARSAQASTGRTPSIVPSDSQAVPELNMRSRTSQQLSASIGSVYTAPQNLKAIQRAARVRKADFLVPPSQTTQSMVQLPFAQAPKDERVERQANQRRLDARLSNKGRLGDRPTPRDSKSPPLVPRSAWQDSPERPRRRRRTSSGGLADDDAVIRSGALSHVRVRPDSGGGQPSVKGGGSRRGSPPSSPELEAMTAPSFMPLALDASESEDSDLDSDTQWSMPTNGPHDMQDASRGGQGEWGGTACAVMFVELEQCNRISSRGISALARHAPQLRGLNLRGCESINSSAVEVLAKMCPRLSTLCVDGCWQLHIASSFTMEKLPAREFGKQLAKLAKASSLQTFTGRGVVSIDNKTIAGLVRSLAERQSDAVGESSFDRAPSSPSAPAASMPRNKPQGKPRANESTSHLAPRTAWYAQFRQRANQPPMAGCPASCIPSSHLLMQHSFASNTMIPLETTPYVKPASKTPSRQGKRGGTRRDLPDQSMNGPSQYGQGPSQYSVDGMAPPPVLSHGLQTLQLSHCEGISDFGVILLAGIWVPTTLFRAQQVDPALAATLLAVPLLGPTGKSVVDKEPGGAGLNPGWTKPRLATTHTASQQSSYTTQRPPQQADTLRVVARQSSQFTLSVDVESARSRGLVMDPIIESDPASARHRRGSNLQEEHKGDGVASPGRRGSEQPSLSTGRRGSKESGVITGRRGSAMDSVAGSMIPNHSVIQLPFGASNALLTDSDFFHERMIRADIQTLVQSRASHTAADDSCGDSHLQECMAKLKPQPIIRSKVSPHPSVRPSRSAVPPGAKKGPKSKSVIAEDRAIRVARVGKGELLTECSATRWEPSPWWQCDLGRTVPLDSVQITLGPEVGGVHWDAAWQSVVHRRATARRQKRTHGSQHGSKSTGSLKPHPGPLKEARVASVVRSGWFFTNPRPMTPTAGLRRLFANRFGSHADRLHHDMADSSSDSDSDESAHLRNMGRKVEIDVAVVRYTPKPSPRAAGGLASVSSPRPLPSIQQSASLTSLGARPRQTGGASIQPQSISRTPRLSARGAEEPVSEEERRAALLSTMRQKNFHLPAAGSALRPPLVVPTSERVTRGATRRKRRIKVPSDALRQIERSAVEAAQQQKALWNATYSDQERKSQQHVMHRSLAGRHIVKKAERERVLLDHDGRRVLQIDNVAMGKKAAKMRKPLQDAASSEGRRSSTGASRSGRVGSSTGAGLSEDSDASSDMSASRPKESAVKGALGKLFLQASSGGGEGVEAEKSEPSLTDVVAPYAPAGAEYFMEQRRLMKARKVPQRNKQERLAKLWLQQDEGGGPVEPGDESSPEPELSLCRVPMMQTVWVVVFAQRPLGDVSNPLERLTSGIPIGVDLPEEDDPRVALSIDATLQQGEKLRRSQQQRSARLKARATSGRDVEERKSPTGEGTGGKNRGGNGTQAQHRIGGRAGAPDVTRWEGALHRTVHAIAHARQGGGWQPGTTNGPHGSVAFAGAFTWVKLTGSDVMAVVFNPREVAHTKSRTVAQKVQASTLHTPSFGSPQPSPVDVDTAQLDGRDGTETDTSALPRVQLSAPSDWLPPHERLVRHMRMYAIPDWGERLQAARQAQALSKASQAPSIAELSGHTSPTPHIPKLKLPRRRSSDFVPPQAVQSTDTMSTWMTNQTNRAPRVRSTAPNLRGFERDLLAQIKLDAVVEDGRLGGFAWSLPDVKRSTWAGPPSRRVGAGDSHSPHHQYPAHGGHGGRIGVADGGAEYGAARSHVVSDTSSAFTDASLDRAGQSYRFEPFFRAITGYIAPAGHSAGQSAARIGGVPGKVRSGKPSQRKAACPADNTIFVTQLSLRNVTVVAAQDPLDRLALDYCSLLTDISLSYIGGTFSFLSYLSLSGCSGLTSRGLDRLFRAAPPSWAETLTHISLASLPTANDIVIKAAIDACPRMRVLMLSLTDINAAQTDNRTGGTAHGDSMGSMSAEDADEAGFYSHRDSDNDSDSSEDSELSHAGLDYEDKGISDESLAHLVLNCPELLLLDVAGQRRVSSIGVVLLPGIPSLRLVNLTDCHRVSAEAVRTCASRLPFCQGVHRGTDLPLHIEDLDLGATSVDAGGSDAASDVVSESSTTPGHPAAQSIHSDALTVFSSHRRHQADATQLSLVEWEAACAEDKSWWQHDSMAWTPLLRGEIDSPSIRLESLFAAASTLPAADADTLHFVQSMETATTQRVNETLWAARTPHLKQMAHADQHVLRKQMENVLCGPDQQSAGGGSPVVRSVHSPTQGSRSPRVFSKAPGSRLIRSVDHELSASDSIDRIVTTDDAAAAHIGLSPSRETASRSTVDHQASQESAPPPSSTLTRLAAFATGLVTGDVRMTATAARKVDSRAPSGGAIDEGQPVHVPPQMDPDANVECVTVWQLPRQWSGVCPVVDMSYRAARVEQLRQQQLRSDTARLIQRWWRCCHAANSRLLQLVQASLVAKPRARDRERRSSISSVASLEVDTRTRRQSFGSAAVAFRTAEAEETAAALRRAEQAQLPHILTRLPIWSKIVGQCSRRANHLLKFRHQRMVLAAAEAFQTTADKEKHLTTTAYKMWKRFWIVRRAAQRLNHWLNRRSLQRKIAQRVAERPQRARAVGSIRTWWRRVWKIKRWYRRAVRAGTHQRFDMREMKRWARRVIQAWSQRAALEASRKRKALRSLLVMWTNATVTRFVMRWRQRRRDGRVAVVLAEAGAAEQAEREARALADVLHDSSEEDDQAKATPAATQDTPSLPASSPRSTATDAASPRYTESQHAAIQLQRVARGRQARLQAHQRRMQKVQEQLHLIPTRSPAATPATSAQPSSTPSHKQRGSQRTSPGTGAASASGDAAADPVTLQQPHPRPDTHHATPTVASHTATPNASPAVNHAEDVAPGPVRDALLLDEAATSVQRVVRGHQTRQDFARYREYQRQEAAATQVQRVARGRRTRLAVDAYRADLKQHEGATAIQAVVRGRKGRKRAARYKARQRKVHAATAIQQRARIWLAYRELHRRRALRRRAKAAKQRVKQRQAEAQALAVERMKQARLGRQPSTPTMRARRPYRSRSPSKRLVDASPSEHWVQQRQRKAAATKVQRAWREHRPASASSVPATARSAVSATTTVTDPGVAANDVMDMLMNSVELRADHHAARPSADTPVPATARSAVSATTTVTDPGVAANDVMDMLMNSVELRAGGGSMEEVGMFHSMEDGDDLNGDLASGSSKLTGGPSLAVGSTIEQATGTTHSGSVEVNPSVDSWNMASVPSLSELPFNQHKAANAPFVPVDLPVLEGDSASDSENSSVLSRSSGLDGNESDGESRADAYNGEADDEVSGSLYDVSQTVSAGPSVGLHQLSAEPSGSLYEVSAEPSGSLYEVSVSGTRTSGPGSEGLVTASMGDSSSYPSVQSLPWLPVNEEGLQKPPRPSTALLSARSTRSAHPTTRDLPPRDPRQSIGGRSAVSERGSGARRARTASITDSIYDYDFSDESDLDNSTDDERLLDLRDLSWAIEAEREEQEAALRALTAAAAAETVNGIALEAAEHADYAEEMRALAAGPPRGSPVPTEQADASVDELRKELDGMQAQERELDALLAILDWLQVCPGLQRVKAVVRKKHSAARLGQWYRQLRARRHHRVLLASLARKRQQRLREAADRRARVSRSGAEHMTEDAVIRRTMSLQVGDRVKGQWLGGAEWYPAVVAAVVGPHGPSVDREHDKEGTASTLPTARTVGSTTSRGRRFTLSGVAPHHQPGNRHTSSQGGRDDGASDYSGAGDSPRFAGAASTVRRVSAGTVATLALGSAPLSSRSQDETIWCLRYGDGYVEEAVPRHRIKFIRRPRPGRQSSAADDDADVREAFKRQQQRRRERKQLLALLPPRAKAEHEDSTDSAVDKPRSPAQPLVTDDSDARH